MKKLNLQTSDIISRLSETLFLLELSWLRIIHFDIFVSSSQAKA